MHLAYSYFAMAPTTASTTSLPTLTQKGAKVAIQAAEQHALEMGISMFVPATLSSYKFSRRTRSIVVLDAHTHLLSFTRMDGANIATINTAMDMAYTAASNGISTSTCTPSHNPHLFSPHQLTTSPPLYQIKKPLGPIVPLAIQHPTV